jgi:hypothetical protein
LWLAVLAFNIWALLLSLSRAAWLGAFLSVIIAWLVFGKELKKITWHPKVKKHWGSLVLLIVLVLGLVAFNHSFQSRIASMFELRGGSVAVRLHYWPVALQAISERPIFGYGLENQDAAFLPYYQANWAYIGPVNSFPNRAHNFVLDILLTSGLVGLLAYALLLIFLFRQILAIKKNNRSLSFLLFLAISGYLLSLLFGFTFVSANVVLLIFGAIILMSSEKTEANYKLKPSAKIIGLIVLVLILFLVLFSWTREKSRLLADNYFWQARRSFNSQDFKAADAWFARLKSLPINTRSYDYFYLNQLYYSWNDQPGPTDLYLKAVRFYQLISYPDDASYEQAMAKAELATILGNYELAGKLWDNFIDKNPKLPEAYRLKAIMAYGAKNYQLAADLEQKTLSLLPSGPGVIGDGRSLGIL